VSHLVELVAPCHWGHVDGVENPADCASRGLMPSELIVRDLWWNGPGWLKMNPADWPKQPQLPPSTHSDEDEICHHVVTRTAPIVPIENFSTFSRLIRITAWVMRFTRNCLACKRGLNRVLTPLGVDELRQAGSRWPRKISFMLKLLH